jgi:hypothetical protein
MNMIIMKAMAKAKHDRYDSVADMMNDLENMRAKPGQITQYRASQCPA